jgi:putative FmdB family regulatory protein
LGLSQKRDILYFWFFFIFDWEVTMPIYEYKCHACGHTLEVLQKISDSPLTECPNCGKSSLDKVISATQFQLKGSGWYATDFKTSSAPKKEDAATTTESSTEKKSETKVPPVDSK